LLVVLAATAVLATACPTPPPAPPGIPASFVRVSPADGVDYGPPVISGDGDTVVYRRLQDMTPVNAALAPSFVSRVSTHTTQQFPDVGTVVAVSHDGRYVVHGAERKWPESVSPPLRLLDTATGDETDVPGIGAETAQSVRVSDDGTVALIFPVEDSPLFAMLTLVMWHEGRPAASADLGLVDRGNHTDVDRSVFLSSDGTSVLAHDVATGSFTRYDTTTAAATPAGFVLPTPPSTVDSMTWASPDLTTVDLQSFPSDWRLHTVAPAEPIDPALLDAHGFSDNGAWGITFTDVVTGPIPPIGTPPLYRTLQVLDRTDGSLQPIVSSSNYGAFHFAAFMHVADSGRVALSYTNSADGGQPTAPWIVYVVEGAG
jgi:hypothetical protein